MVGATFFVENEGFPPTVVGPRSSAKRVKGVPDGTVVAKILPSLDLCNDAEFGSNDSIQHIFSQDDWSRWQFVVFITTEETLHTGKVQLPIVPSRWSAHAKTSGVQPRDTPTEVVLFFRDDVLNYSSSAQPIRTQPYLRWDGTTISKAVVVGNIIWRGPTLDILCF